MSNYVNLPITGSSSGVVSLNGLVGALTLVAGANVTITPSGTNITIAASSGSGNILSINSDTTAAQTLSVGTAGTNFAIVDAGSGSHVFNLPTASASARGALSSADWSTFNNKLASTDGAYLLKNTSDPTKTQLYDLSGQTTATALTISPQNTSNMVLHIPQVATASGAGMALVQDETTGFIFSNGITSSLGGANSMMQLANATTANRAQIKLHSYFNGTSVAGVSTLTSRSGVIGTNAAVVAGQDYSKWTAQAGATTPGSAPISGAFAFKANAVNSLTVPSDFHIQLTNTAGTLADRLYLTSEGILQLPALNVAGGYVQTDSSGNLSSSVPPNSSTSTTGFLTSTDWNTFNGKQAAGNYLTALTGDATASGPGSAALTLTTVNSNVGSFGTATNVGAFTVNGKGLITAASSTAIQITESQVTNLTTDLAAKASTSLNNLASTAFNVDIIPANSALNMGSTTIPMAHVYSQNFMNPVASSNLTINTATIGSGAAASGTLTLNTGIIDTGTSGPINIGTGGSAGLTGNSANVTISTGNASGATSGTSGNINLTIGNATTTNGAIVMTGGYLRLPRLANDPTGVTGAIYYNTGSNTIRWYNGTVWAALL